MYEKSRSDEKEWILFQVGVELRLIWHQFSQWLGCILWPVGMTCILQSCVSSSTDNFYTSLRFSPPLLCLKFVLEWSPHLIFHDLGQGLSNLTRWKLFLIMWWLQLSLPLTRLISILVNSFIQRLRDASRFYLFIFFRNQSYNASFLFYLTLLSNYSTFHFWSRSQCKNMECINNFKRR